MMKLLTAWTATVAVIAAAIGVACESTEDLVGGLDSFAPVWITASWSGGAAGLPNDRTDREPQDFFGRLCPASSVDLLNYSGGFAGLNVINRCTITVTYYICATRGSLPQPQFGLEECAQDPFDTPMSQLKIIPLTPGVEGDFINATQALSIQVFYCSDESQLFTSPLRCVG